MHDWSWSLDDTDGTENTHVDVPFSTVMYFDVVIPANAPETFSMIETILFIISTPSVIFELPSSCSFGF